MEITWWHILRPTDYACGSRFVVIVVVWASYQIRKITVWACGGNAGNVFPRHRLQRKHLVRDPGMHHGTCVTHVPWCMLGLLTRSGGENVPGHSRRMHNPHFYVSGKRPMVWVNCNDFFRLFVRRAGLLWSQQDFEWLWSVPLSSASLY